MDLSKAIEVARVNSNKWKEVWIVYCQGEKWWCYNWSPRGRLPNASKSFLVYPR